MDRNKRHLQLCEARVRLREMVRDICRFSAAERRAMEFAIAMMEGAA